MGTRNVLPGCHSTQPNTPQPYDSAVLMKLAPTKLVLVDFDSLVRSGDPLISALEIYQYGLFAELAPVSDGRCAKVNTLAG